ncbi:MAG: hypothetical protein M1814_002424 [Vezdaea aestivalis]|nr:MAG: hypothetical protein M1814_002424 [Vezdaea aestivalis]
MSQRPSVPPAPQHGRQESGTSAASADAGSFISGSHPAQTSQTSDMGGYRPISSLPPLRAYPHGGNSPLVPQQPASLSVPRQRPSRGIDVSTMLNPAEVNIEPPPSRRRSAAHFETESSPGGIAGLHHPGSIHTPRPPNPVPSRFQPVAVHGASPHTFQQIPEARRILTPMSPTQRIIASNRAASIAGTFERHDLSPASPNPPKRLRADQFPPARVGSMPMAHSYAGPPGPPQIDSRRSSIAFASKPPSQSVSPSVSYSSASQRDQTSPAQGPTPILGQNPTYHSHHMNVQVAKQAMELAQSSSSDQRRAVSAATTANSDYKFFTLNLEQGPIELPIDVKAASKSADDKRKRNAGASARFRQRRKEKERESSQAISKLEQQAREFAEARDFYRLERDHFRQIVLERLGHSFIGGRPPSPKVQQIPQDGSSLAATPWTPTPPPPASAERLETRSVSVAVPGPTQPMSSGPPPLAPMPSPHPVYRASSYAFEGRQQQQQQSGPMEPHPSQKMVVPKTEGYDPFAPEHYDRSWPSRR